MYSYVHLTAYYCTPDNFIRAAKCKVQHPMWYWSSFESKVGFASWSSHHRYIHRQWDVSAILPEERKSEWRQWDLTESQFTRLSVIQSYEKKRAWHKVVNQLRALFLLWSCKSACKHHQLQALSSPPLYISYASNVEVWLPSFSLPAHCRVFFFFFFFTTET